DNGDPVGLDTQGFGNITFHGKVRLLRYEEHKIGLAAIAHVELPTGNTKQFRGEPGVALWPVLALDWVPVPIFRMGLNVGYRFNSGKGATLPYDGRVRPVNSVGSAAGALLQSDICTGGMNVTNASCPGDVTGGRLVTYGDLITGGVAASLRFAKSAE